MQKLTRLFFFCLTVTLTPPIGLFTIITCASSTTSDQSTSDTDSEFESIFDTITREDIEAIEHYRRSLPPEQQQPCLTDQDIIKLLVQVGAPAALQGRLYKKSNPIVIRSLLDLPSLLFLDDQTENFTFSGKIFYNQDREVILTDNSTRLASYLNVNMPDFLQQLELEDFGIDVPDIFPLLANVRLEERRIGFMFSFCRRWDTVKLRIAFPFYYLEHNFFLNEEELSQIQDSPLFSEFTPTRSDAEDAEAFFREHLVSDKIGFGDMRINALYHTLETPCSDLWLGGLLTLPSARTVACGFIGGCFRKPLGQPRFDLRAPLIAFFCQNDPQQAFDLALNLGIKAVDALTANLANTSLGNNGHVGIGPFLQHVWYLTPDARLVSNGSVEYQFSAPERRFFIVRVNPYEFAERDFNDPNQATSNINFLNRQLINTLFPFVAETRVRPGPLVKFSTALVFDPPNYTIELGYDFWWQGHERVKLKPTHHRLPPLDIARGLKPSAYQNKFFGKIIRYVQTQGGCYDWHIGLCSDITFSQKGIGRDFTVAIDLGVDF